MSSSIPILAGQSLPNLMVSGPNGLNLAAQAKKGHPLDFSRSQPSSAEQGAAGPSSGAFDVDAVRRIYGAGLALTIKTERELAMNVGGR